jgi:hypothetical protein
MPDEKQNTQVPDIRENDDGLDGNKTSRKKKGAELETSRLLSLSLFIACVDERASIFLKQKSRKWGWNSSESHS